MFVHVKRDPRESFERMLSRFKKLLQRSHKLQLHREKNNFRKDKTKKRIREEAIMRDYYRAKRRKAKFY
jgi:ribosomal protein S21